MKDLTDLNELIISLKVEHPQLTREDILDLTEAALTDKVHFNGTLVKILRENS